MCVNLFMEVCTIHGHFSLHEFKLDFLTLIIYVAKCLTSYTSLITYLLIPYNMKDEDEKTLVTNLEMLKFYPS